MDYTDEFLKKVTSIGALGYSLRRALLVINVQDERQFAKDWDDKDSPVYKAYQRGRASADYTIHSKLYELAKTGDTKAIEMYAVIVEAEQEIEHEDFIKRNAHG